MKLTLLILLTALTAHAASVTVEWNASTTQGCSNVLFFSRLPLTNLTTAPYRFPMGTNTTARATLSPEMWHLACVAVLDGVQSDPALLTVIVPASVTALREMPAVAVKARALMGHDRQRRGGR